MKIRLWYILLFLSLAIESFAQVSFTARANKYKIGRNEQFTVEFKVNNQARSFRAPDFNGLRVLSGPNQSSTSYIDNSGMRQSISYNYIVSGTKEGQFTIGSASIQVDGKVYKTKPFAIEITKSSAKSANANDPYSIAARSAFIKILLSKSTVYQGEPLIASYKIYFKAQIGRWEVLEAPSYTGFYKEDIPLDYVNTQTERYKDESFQTGIIQQLLLIPQKSGTIRLGAAEIKIPTQIPNGRRDIFGRRMSQTVNQTSTAKFPPIIVKPLPQAGRPSNFSGAVGNFKMDVSISRNEVTANESVTLKVKLTGTGNIKLTELPKPELPSAFEAYDPKYSENIKVDASGMKGSKTYEYLLIPRYGGTYKIPPVSFNYFNTKTGKYKSLTSESFEVTVTGGAANPGTNGSNGVTSTTQEDVDFIGNGILYIKTRPGNLALKGSSFFKSSGFYTTLSLLILFSLGLIIFSLLNRRKSTDTAKLKQGRANKVARKHLQEAKKMLDSAAKDAFYLALSSAIWGYFSDKMNIPQSKISKDMIKEELEVRQVDSQSIEKALDIMNRAEMARFTSVGGSSSASDYEETAEVITEIEKQLG